ncbi:hypothetical protein ACLOJK_041747 [Asimina triloba]
MSRVFGVCKALMAAASASASSAAKGSGTKKGASAAAAARNVGSGIQKAAPVSPAMSEFLGGVHEISRTDCVKKVWEHIKLHQLQRLQQGALLTLTLLHVLDKHSIISGLLQEENTDDVTDVVILPRTNPANKKEICCDEKLKAIFGGKDRVDFLEISKLLSFHFVKTK